MKTKALVVTLHAFLGLAAAGAARADTEAVVATPTFTPAPGTYQEGLAVTIECATPAAAIHYTTNGRDPTRLSPRYQSPIAISSTTTLKARAFRLGSTRSDVASGLFTVVSSLGLSLVAPGLDNLVAITHAGDGSGRLFLTLQQGQVVVFDGTGVLPTPFLDIRPAVLSGGEQGLLSVAFHPRFPSVPYFYVDYTRRPDGYTVIERYRLSAGDPNQADPASAATLLVIPQPYPNHNGGQLQFGPDGYLYIGMGDGGSGNDPECRAQRDDTLLGKMLRIDVDQGFDAPPYYGIPPSNPMTVGPPEAWAEGLRNPWRFTFDRETGDLFIGDVGQSAIEEVDFEPAGFAGGRNYGWKMMEGSSCGAGGTSGCPPGVPPCHDASLTLPVIEYAHVSGRCSITGGYRYRGSHLPLLAGRYVYADYCTGEIFGATLAGNVWTSAPLLSPGYSISSFGEDESGELYVARYGVGGGLYRLTPQP